MQKLRWCETFPTPAGVPVAIISPGSNVIPLLIVEMISSIEKIILFVLKFVLLLHLLPFQCNAFGALTIDL